MTAWKLKVGCHLLWFMYQSIHSHSHRQTSVLLDLKLFCFVEYFWFGWWFTQRSIAAPEWCPFFFSSPFHILYPSFNLLFSLNIVVAFLFANFVWLFVCEFFFIAFFSNAFCIWMCVQKKKLHCLIKMKEFSFKWFDVYRMSSVLFYADLCLKLASVCRYVLNLLPV